MFAVAVLLCLGAWGPAGCAPSAWSGAPVFVPQPPAFVVPSPRPPAIDPVALEKEIDRILTKRAEKAAKKKANHACVGSCECGRCGESCPCRAGNGRCGDGCKCVVAMPEAGPIDAEKLVAAGETNFGIDRSKMDGESRPRYRHHNKSGVREITQGEALRLLEKDVPDDAGKRRLTVIGPEIARKAFDAWWKGADAARYRDQYLVQLYAEDDWHVKSGGFVSPAIYLQAADGLVLHRQADVGDLKGLEKAIVRAAPDYDPAKDPDLSKAPPKVPSPLAPALDGLNKLLTDVPPFAWFAGLVALMLLMNRKRETK